MSPRGPGRNDREHPEERALALPIAIAVAVPLVFLYLVRWLDLYASGSFKVVLVCLGWGGVAFLGAYFANTFALGFVGFTLLATLVAPINEEILKSLALVYLVRRPSFTYFVDGAVYGFAAGTAFAVLEAVLYVTRSGADEGLGLSLARGFSTSLMHGSSSALVGIALGRMRFGRGIARPASLLMGWAAAMALHITFNNVVNSQSGFTVIFAVLLGLGGLGLVATFIFWGLREEGRWLKETLGVGVGVSSGESAVVQKMADLDLLLEPVEQRFGPEKRKQVESFVRLQAQLGLKRKAQEMTPDPRLRQQLAAQVETMREEIDALRHAVGVYCMSYVRSILPPETEPLWGRLGQTIEAHEPTSGRSLWGTLGEKMRDGE